MPIKSLILRLLYKNNDVAQLKSRKREQSSRMLHAGADGAVNHSQWLLFAKHCSKKTIGWLINIELIVQTMKYNEILV